MSRPPVSLVVLFVACASVAAVAPVLCIRFAASQPRLSRDAQSFESHRSCRRIQDGNYPDPRKPIAAADLTSAPCSLNGAMVVDKTTVASFGVAPSYALDIRDDAGRGESVALGGPGDAALWNAVDFGKRVIVQRYDGRAVTIDDGSTAVATRANPLYLARTNQVSLSVCGALTALEVVGLALVLAVRRRSV